MASASAAIAWAILCHLAVGKGLDIMGVVRRLVVGLGIFFDVGVDVGEYLAHVVVGDARAERGHGDLQIGEGLLGAIGRALVVPAEQLVDVQPHQQQLLQRFAGQDHVVGIARLGDRRGLQLLDLG